LLVGEKDLPPCLEGAVEQAVEALLGRIDGQLDIDRVGAIQMDDAILGRDLARLVDLSQWHLGRARLVIQQETRDHDALPHLVRPGRAAQ